MNSPNTELEAWLAGNDVIDDLVQDSGDWVAGFDPDRQLVKFKIGPYKKLYLRPEKFTKRFYHQIVPLVIDTWSFRRQIKLFEDFCTVDIQLDLRFQATLKYVQKNAERIETINQHIKQLYADIIEDTVTRELRLLDDGTWIHNGLSDHEKHIALGVCEILMQQHIQAQAICSMSVAFAEFPDIQLGKDSVYVAVLKKTFEFGQEKAKELYRQQRLAEQQALLEKQQHIEHLKQLALIRRQIQAHEAEVELELLNDKEQQIIRQRDTERRLHAEHVTHEQQLKEISFDIEAQFQQQLHAKQRLLETELLAEQLAHQAYVEDKKIAAEIERQQAAYKRLQEVNQFASQSSVNNVQEE